MVKASEEIKSTVTVSTSEGEKRSDEHKDLQHKDVSGGLRRTRGKTFKISVFNNQVGET